MGNGKFHVTESRSELNDWRVGGGGQSGDRDGGNVARWVGRRRSDDQPQDRSDADKNWRGSDNRGIRDDKDREEDLAAFLSFRDWRVAGDDRPSQIERPRLNLKPRS